jgi:hypothetical protein
VAQVTDGLNRTLGARLSQADVADRIKELRLFAPSPKSPQAPVPVMKAAPVAPKPQPVIEAEPQKTRMTQKGVPLERGVPIPEAAATVSKGSAYPWDEMEVGESFFIPSSDHKPQSVFGMANGASRRGASKFVARQVQGGARVWRTA